MLAPLVLISQLLFLLGPRQTGKSWLLRKQLVGARVYNLLDVETYRALSRRPGLLREELAGIEDTVVVIDEVQLIPELLNEVHILIEEAGTRFLLTGSSARKLKSQGVNLLGGRARWKALFPLIRKELGDQFSLKTALERGTMPSIYTSDDYRNDLKDYVDLYLKEEIARETAIRQLTAYSRFLDTAALCNAQIINYTEIGSDIQLSPSTVREYFFVLEDTLLTNRLPAWRESKKRKATARDKFYFFDIGVARYIQGRKELIENSDDFSSALETYMFHELKAYSEYVSNDPISYWRTTTGFEVDFLIGKHTAIEIKSTRSANARHLKGLLALKEEEAFKRYLLVTLDPRERTLQGCNLLSVEKFLDLLWDGEFSA